MLFIFFCFIVTILFHSILPYRDTVNCYLFHQWCAGMIFSSDMNNKWCCHLTHTASVAVINDNVDNQLADPGVNRLHYGGAGIGSISMRNLSTIRCFQFFWWTIQQFLMIVHYDNKLFLRKRKYTFLFTVGYRLHDMSSCYWRKRAPLNTEHCLSQIYLSILLSFFSLLHWVIKYFVEWFWVWLKY